MLNDIAQLSAQLGTISALSKVVVDLAKTYLPKPMSLPNAKYTSSLVISTALTLLTDVSLFSHENAVLHYAGCVAAGLIAGLGSNVINDTVKSLEALKSLRQPKQ